MAEKVFLKISSMKMPPGEGKFLSFGINKTGRLLSELDCDCKKTMKTAKYLLVSSSSNTFTIPQPCCGI